MVAGGARNIAVAAQELVEKERLAQFDQGRGNSGGALSG
jgi:hypothetical protein